MSAAPFPRSFTPAEAQSSISSFWVCRSLSYCLRLLACHLRVLATRSRLGACFCVRTHGKSAHDDNAHGSRTNFTTPVFQSGCSPSKTQTASIVACTPFGGCFTLRSGSCDVGEAGENAHRGVTSVPPARKPDTQNARCTPARHTHGQCKHRNRWVAEQGAPHGHVPAPPCRHHPPRPRCPGCCLRSSASSQSTEQRLADWHRTSWYDRRFVDAFDPWVFTSS